MCKDPQNWENKQTETKRFVHCHFFKTLLLPCSMKGPFNVKPEQFHARAFITVLHIQCLNILGAWSIDNARLGQGRDDCGNILPLSEKET